MSKKMFSAKRIFAALVAVMMLVAIVPAASAAINLSIDETTVVEDTILITLNVGQYTAREHIITIVTPQGVDASYENAVAYSYDQATSASCPIIVQMPDGLKTGTYKVTIGAPSAAASVSTEVIYMGDEDRKAIMDNVNSDNADAATLVTAFNKSPLALDVAGSYNKYYKALSNNAKTQFAQYIIDNRDIGDKDKSGKLEMFEIGILANEALIVTYFDNQTISKEAADVAYTEMFANLAEDYLSNLDLGDNRYKKISNSTEFFRVVRSQPGYTPTVDGIDACIEAGLTIERINEAGWLEVGEVITDLRYDLPDEVSDEITLDKLEKITQNSTIKSYFGKSVKANDIEYKNVPDDEKLPAYTFADLLKVWNRAYADANDKYDEYLENKDDNKKPSGGGSGGGGGGGSGNVTSNVTVNRDALRPDPLGQKKLVSDYYDDMAGYEWASVAVLNLTEKGIVNGTGDKKFNPAGALKREEFMKMLVNTFNLVDMTATCSFSDCDRNSWYYIYVASAEKAGITNGRGDGTFGVGDYVTREEMAAMIYRLARNSGVYISGTGNVSRYSDIGSVADYAVEAVNALVAGGIIGGESDGRFNPKGNATRAQAAVAIYNINNLYNK